MHILHIETLLCRFGHLLLQNVGEPAGTRVPIVVHVAKAPLVLEKLYPDQAQHESSKEKATQIIIRMGKPCEKIATSVQ